MRPDPTERHENDSSGRIIYLGDVRRRRGSKRQSPDTHYLAAFALVAAAGWAAWAIVLFNLSPSRLLSYIAFMAPLAVALAATASLAAYFVEHQRDGYASLRAAARRGALFAIVIVVNLTCLGAHRWSVVVLALSVVVIVGLDVVAARRS